MSVTCTAGRSCLASMLEALGEDATGIMDDGLPRAPLHVLILERITCRCQRAPLSLSGR